MTLLPPNGCKLAIVDDAADNGDLNDGADDDSDAVDDDNDADADAADGRDDSVRVRSRVFSSMTRRRAVMRSMSISKQSM
jgi:hypothetical protein